MWDGYGLAHLVQLRLCAWLGFFPAAAVRQVQPGLGGRHAGIIAEHARNKLIVRGVRVGVDWSMIRWSQWNRYIAERAIGTSVMCACPTEIVALTWCSATVRVRGEGLGIVAVGDVQNTRLGSDCHG